MIFSAFSFVPNLWGGEIEESHQLESGSATPLLQNFQQQREALSIIVIQSGMSTHLEESISTHLWLGPVER